MKHLRNGTYTTGVKSVEGKAWPCKTVQPKNKLVVVRSVDLRTGIVTTMNVAILSSLFQPSSLIYITPWY
uniref:DUF5641 domain-containing protein n=1 Tax=Loa loa TaxID=7209 RepID=A0A1I7VWB7_LOALO